MKSRYAFLYAFIANVEIIWLVNLLLRIKYFFKLPKLKKDEYYNL